MLIDTHIHQNFGDTTTETFVQRVERGLTDRFWVSSVFGGYYPTLADVRASNDAVYALRQRLPGHIEGFSYVNPAHGTAALEEMERNVGRGFRGVKLWVATFCDDPRVYPIVERAIAHGLPLLVHCWVKVGQESPTSGNLPCESTPMQLGHLAARYPEAKLIMAHLGGDWEYGVKVARDHPNIYVDTSGSLAEMDSIERLVEEVGIERVIFGTDNSDLSYCLGKIAGAALTPAQREAIFWQNAARLIQ
jgi:hypothetical protein